MFYGISGVCRANIRAEMTGGTGLFETKKQGDFMIKKSLFHILAIGFIAVALTACGGKGVDRKLNYSGTAEELGESYGKAVADATPEQQNVLRKRMLEVLGYVVSLAKNSNPANIDAFVAKKNADEFQRLSKMTVRELLVDNLEKQQRTLNSAITEFEKFQSGNTLKVESVSITETAPKDITDNTSRIDIKGTLLLQNDSKSFDYAISSCTVILVLDGKPIEPERSCGGSWKTIKSNGGKESFTLGYPIREKENVKIFYDLFKSGQMDKIAWRFKPNEDFAITSNSNKDEDYRIGVSDFEQKYKENLQKVAADLAVLKI